MDIIYIHDIKISTIIGIFEWERKIRQTVYLDLDMSANVQLAARSDHIDDTLDYKKLTKRIIQYAEESNFQLVETLAEKIAALVMQEFGVKWLRIKVNKKGALSDAVNVGVIIERGSKS